MNKYYIDYFNDNKYKVKIYNDLENNNIFSFGIILL